MLNNAKIKKSLQGKFQLPGKHDLKIIMRCDYKIRIKKPPKYIRQCFQEPFIQTKEPLGSQLSGVSYRAPDLNNEDSKNNLKDIFPSAYQQMPNVKQNKQTNKKITYLYESVDKAFV